MVHLHEEKKWKIKICELAWSCAELAVVISRPASYRRAIVVQIRLGKSLKVLIYSLKGFNVWAVLPFGWFRGRVLQLRDDNACFWFGGGARTTVFRPFVIYWRSSKRLIKISMSQRMCVITYFMKFKMGLNMSAANPGGNVRWESVYVLNDCFPTFYALPTVAKTTIYSPHDSKELHVKKKWFCCININ